MQQGLMRCRKTTLFRSLHQSPTFVKRSWATGCPRADQACPLRLPPELDQRPRGRTRTHVQIPSGHSVV